ncbi:MAG: phosphate acetyltransferase [Candidatus Omnitrophota bacterium]|nr:MAG: phosphate acetyltransferase [Candidatus Omnitrophota bacterium]
MADIINLLREKAKKKPKKIVFPEPDDERILEAVDYIEKEKIAYPLLLTKDKLEPEKQEEFASLFHQWKQAKGVSFEEARELMTNPLYYAAMLVRCGYAHGIVAGAIYTTSSVIRSALNCLEIDRSIGLVSGCFIMVVPDCDYGEAGTFIYADCGVVPYPSSEQLANIAVSSARFAKEVLEFCPRVAFLSFSTKGSAGGRWVDKIREAVKIAESKDKEFSFDGELQADSALVPEVAERKLDKSKVAGRANVLIFPNLDAGNICYKLTERLAKARAVGPIILGTVQPCGDLSRGCSVEDIIDSTVITVIRA